MEKIILVGGGGHCKSVIDTIKSSNLYEIYGIIDLAENIGKEINGVKIIDCDKNLYKYVNNIKNAFITVGSIGNSSIRIKLYRLIKSMKFNIPSIIDSTAILGQNILIKDGTFVGKGAIINNATCIGYNCIINTATIIEHDCIIENNVHIAPRTVLCGGVKIGENSHIGAGSTIIQYKSIGKNTIIGAGSVVVKNIKSNVKAYGNPCREV